MKNLIESIKNNPVRVYSVVNAVLVLAVVYFPALPVVAILGVAAAVLGIGGEAVRAAVTPVRKLNGGE